MRIILLGAPGSGKGTQSQFISQQYRIKKISSGDILRKYTKQNNKICKEIKNFIKKGKLIPDKLIINIILKEIRESNLNSGFLLEGFPRNIEQATILKKLDININYVIELMLSEKTIINRLNHRLIHLSSGRVYHKKYNPPKIKNKDDVTGELLIKRKDDNINIIKFRLKEYFNFIKPISLFYEQESQKGNLIYHKINAEDTIININKRLKEIIV